MPAGPNTPTRSRRLIVLMVVGALMSMVSILTIRSEPAYALCYHTGCDATEPQASGCAASAVNAGTKRFPVLGYDIGVVQGRYSQACASQWTRLTIEKIPGVSFSYSVSYIGMYGNGYNYSGWFGGCCGTWWTAQAGADDRQFYHSGTIYLGGQLYYGATLGPV